MLEHDNIVSHVPFFLRPEFQSESGIQRYKSLADFLAICLFMHQVEPFHSCGRSHIHRGYYLAYFIRGRHWEDPSTRSPHMRNAVREPILLNCVVQLSSLDNASHRYTSCTNGVVG